MLDPPLKETGLRKPFVQLEIPSLSTLIEKLHSLFCIKNPKDIFTEHNYLGHATEIVTTIRQIYLRIPKIEATDIHQEYRALLIKELHSIYEILEDCGWNCTDLPTGLIPANTKKLHQFLNVFSAIAHVEKIHHIFYKRALASPSPSSSSDSEVKTISIVSTAKPSSSITRLVNKIKAGVTMSKEPLMISEPELIYQIDNACTTTEELDFTPLFYAAKYSQEKDVFLSLMRFLRTKSERTYVLKKILKNISNPFYGLNLLMFTALYGTSEQLKDILTIIGSQDYFNKPLNKNKQFEGWTALHFACSSMNQFSENHELAIKKVQLLLEFKTDINKVTESHPPKDALLIAIESGNLGLIQYLIENQIQTPFTHPHLNHCAAIEVSTLLTNPQKEEILSYLNQPMLELEIENASSTSSTSKRKTAPLIEHSRETLFENEEPSDTKEAVETYLKCYLDEHRFQLGQSYGHGDCFFDSFAQALVMQDNSL